MATIPEYDIIKVIGSGCFGYVFEAFDKKKQRKVALKRIEKVGSQLSREYEILFLIKDCQNVVKIEDFFYSKNEHNKLIQNIVFEFVEDNLENLIQRNVEAKTKIPQLEAKKYVYQLLNGLRCIHAKNVAHRDLKPENILLSKDGQIKICDFGSSKVIELNGKNTPYIVSRYYRAPQLILCVTKYSTAIDIWAAGCIMAQLFLMDSLFKGRTQGDQLFAIFKILGSMTPQEINEYKKKVPFDHALFNQFGKFARIDLRQMFTMVDDKSNFLDLLLKLLAYVPQQRISAKQAMEHPFFKEIRQKNKDSIEDKQTVSKKKKIRKQQR